MCPWLGLKMQPPSAAGQEKTRKALSRAGFLILLNPFGLVQTSPKSIIGGCRIRTATPSGCFLKKWRKITQNCANFSPNFFLGFSWTLLYTIGLVAPFIGVKVLLLESSLGNRYKIFNATRSWLEPSINARAPLSRLQIPVN